MPSQRWNQLLRMFRRSDQDDVTPKSNATIDEIETLESRLVLSFLGLGAGGSMTGGSDFDTLGAPQPAPALPRMTEGPGHVSVEVELGSLGSRQLPDSQATQGVDGASDS